MDNFEEEALYESIKELNAEVARLRAQLEVLKVALMHYERRGFQLGMVARDALKELEADD